MPSNYIKQILNANIYDLAIETPLDIAEQLSGRLGNEVLLKREDLQPVFSFKIRGAYNKLLNLSDAEKSAGVVAASAGNHAQGVAMSAKKLGVHATIVMPRTTPSIKVEAVKRLGAQVVLEGDDFASAATHASVLCEAEGRVYIHPFDDPDVIAGQGTVAMEILRQMNRPADAVFIPVGGGGLCAGMAVYLKYLSPQTRVIGVEPEDAACLKVALEKNRRTKLPHVGLFADGAAVAQIGKETYRLLKDSVDEVLTVSTDEICAAIKDIFEDTRSIAEPAGALSVAGMKKWVHQNQVSGRTLVAVDSGANMNFDRLRYISERTEIGEKKEAVFAVTIPEKPGSFRTFCNSLPKRMVTEFNYRLGDSSEAHIFVGLQVLSEEDRLQILDKLADRGFSVVDLTDNEIAKLHIRHMVGGRAPDVADELLYHIEFPERPGALMTFLNNLGGRWNISMFHYRNHGAAFGSVLCGIQVPAGQKRELNDMLAKLGYEFNEETENPGYRMFLT